ncbi:TPA: hypothetical protein N0F65_010844 [Lagenidium giganteum]|uniref:Uncharacterized protein n=1 Tax=Lagenidium giganteum TaxID=4803 RepID=A0AAV2Z3L1_9STRA|nr:TPA: hypothetical protein N0F65_010844 [Lagenidium giganteum]
MNQKTPVLPQRRKHMSMMSMDSERTDGSVVQLWPPAIPEKKRSARNRSQLDHHDHGKRPDAQFAGRHGCAHIGMPGRLCWHPRR